LWQAEKRKDKHVVRCMLAKNIELTLKVLGIKSASKALSAFTIMSAKHDEGLKNDGLLATSGRTED